MPIPDYGDADFAAAFQDHLPQGAVWPRDPDTTQAQFSLALMRQYTVLHQRSVNLLSDAFPVTPIELLPEWELTLGLPDPCAGEAPTTALRQAQVAARFVATGGQSVPYIIAFALALGYVITIQQFTYAAAGRLRAGQPCNGFAWASTWRVHAPATTITHFLAGSGRAGDPLQTFGNAVLSCEINRISPAHTVVQIAFGS